MSPGLFRAATISISDSSTPKLKDTFSFDAWPVKAKADPADCPGAKEVSLAEGFFPAASMYFFAFGAAQLTVTQTAIAQVTAAKKIVSPAMTPVDVFIRDDLFILSSRLSCVPFIRTVTALFFRTYQGTSFFLTGPTATTPYPYMTPAHEELFQLSNILCEFCSDCKGNQSRRACLPRAAQAYSHGPCRLHRSGLHVTYLLY